MSERLKEMFGRYGIHGREEMMELRERYMKLINHYNTHNYEKLSERCKEYHGRTCPRYNSNFNINRIKFFEDIPDDIEILIDYVDVIALRTANIPSELIYESIYRKLPELFKE